MLVKVIKSVNFKEAHIANHLMYLTEIFAVKLLQIAVSDVSSKKVPARILLIELIIINFFKLNVTKNANFWRHKSTGAFLSIKSKCEKQTAFGALKTIYS